jgi:hypothetical protein
MKRPSACWRFTSPVELRVLAVRDNVADIEVHADAWSLDPGFSFSRTGGSSYNINLREYNPWARARSSTLGRHRPQRQRVRDRQRPPSALGRLAHTHAHRSGRREGSR